MFCVQLVLLRPANVVYAGSALDSAACCAGLVVPVACVLGVQCAPLTAAVCQLLRVGFSWVRLNFTYALVMHDWSQRQFASRLVATLLSLM